MTSQQVTLDRYQWEMQRFMHSDKLRIADPYPAKMEPYIALEKAEYLTIEYAAEYKSKDKRRGKERIAYCTLTDYGRKAMDSVIKRANELSEELRIARKKEEDEERVKNTAPDLLAALIGIIEKNDPLAWVNAKEVIAKARGEI